MKLIKFYPDDGSRGPIVVNQDRIDGITEEWGKAIIHAGSLKFRVRESQREVCERLQQCVIASDIEAPRQTQIVRCKDCEHHGSEDCPLFTDAVEFVTDDDWFCADGIPKDDAK